MQLRSLLAVRQPRVRVAGGSQALLLFLLATDVCALDNGLGLTPPLGWQSFLHFGCSLNETIVRGQVDALLHRGFRDVGYRYVIMGDCWMSTQRDDHGNLQADPVLFPSGLPALAKYIHDAGLKFGIYLSAGTKTCSKDKQDPSHPDGWGSFGNETRDATFIASVGADYLFYDAVCSVPPPPSGVSPMDYQKTLVTRMGEALNATGRPIYYAYGSPYVWKGETVTWVAEKEASKGGLNQYRSSFDMGDRWNLVVQQISGLWGLEHWAEAGLTRPGSWASLDKLEIGNGIYNASSGKGLTTTQSRTYFSWWAIANAPLFMTADLTILDEELCEIMRNPEVLAINQDFAGHVGMPVNSTKKSRFGEVWAKPLSSGAAAAFLRGQGDQGQWSGTRSGGSHQWFLQEQPQQPRNSQNITVFFEDLGFRPTTRASVRDASRRQDLGTFVGAFSITVEQDDSALLVITPASDDHPPILV